MLMVTNAECRRENKIPVHVPGAMALALNLCMSFQCRSFYEVRNKVIGDVNYIGICGEM